MSRDVQIVFTQDLGSGKVHSRMTVNGKPMSFEEDNLDAAGEFRTLDSIDGIDRKDLCLRCFPLMFNGEDVDLPGTSQPSAD